MYQTSEVEYAQQKILEVLVSGNHARKILEICSELLQLHTVVRFNVVPTPHKLVKGLLLVFAICQYFRMLLGIKGLTKLLESHLRSSSDDLSHSLVSFNYRFVSIFIHFSSEIIQKLSIVDLSSCIISFEKMRYFLFC